MRREVSVFVVVLFSCALLACGKKAEEVTIEKQIAKQSGGQAKVDLSKQKVQIKTAEGEMTITGGGGAKLPDGFPKDVFVYKKASILMSAKQEDTFMVTLQSTDDANTVVEAYKKQMVANGWEEKTVMNMPMGTMLHYEKGERSVALTISAADDQTQIQIVANEGEK